MKGSRRVGERARFCGLYLPYRCKNISPTMCVTKQMQWKADSQRGRVTLLSERSLHQPMSIWSPSNKLVLMVCRHLGWALRRHFETRQPFPSVWRRRQGSKLCNQPCPRGLQRTEDWKLVQAAEGLALTQLSLLSQTKAGIPVLPGKVGQSQVRQACAKAES